MCCEGSRCVLNKEFNLEPARCVPRRQGHTMPFQLDSTGRGVINPGRDVLRCWPDHSTMRTSAGLWCLIGLALLGTRAVPSQEVVHVGNKLKVFKLGASMTDLQRLDRCGRTAGQLVPSWDRPEPAGGPAGTGRDPEPRLDCLT